MADTGYRIVISAVDKSSAVFGSVLHHAKALGSQLRSALSAPLRAMASPSSMALVYNVKAAASAFESLYAHQDEARIASAKLGAILKATGGAAGFTAAQLKRDAEAYQKTTTFDADAVVNAQAVLASFKNISGPTFKDATKAAMDLSAAMGGDLQGAIVQVGKALNNPTEGLAGLSRVGVTFSVGQKSQIQQLVDQNNLFGAQAVILRELQSEFGGVAEALAGGAGGKIKQIKNQLGDLLESLAGIAEPVVLAISESVERGIFRIQTFFGDIQRFATANFAQLKAMFGTGLAGVERHFSGGADLLRSMFTSSNAELAAKVYEGFAKLPIYGMLLSKYIQEGALRFGSLMLQGVDDVKFELADVLEQIGQSSLGSMVFGDMASTVEKLRSSATESIGDPQSLANQATRAIVATRTEIGRLKEELAKAGEQASKLKTNMAAETALTGLKGMVESAGGLFSRYFGGLRKAAEGPKRDIQDIAQAMTAAGQAVKDATRELERIQGGRASIKKQKFEDELAFRKAQLGGNEAAQRREDFEAAKKTINNAIAARNPEARQEWMGIGHGILKGLRENPAIIADKGAARKVEDQWQRLGGKREAFQVDAEIVARSGKRRTELNQADADARKRAADEQEKQGDVLARTNKILVEFGNTAAAAARKIKEAMGGGPGPNAGPVPRWGDRAAADALMADIGS